MTNLEKRVDDLEQKYALLPEIKMDKFGGSFVKRRDMRDFLKYNLSLMRYSIKGNKRIPDERKELPKHSWW